MCTEAQVIESVCDALVRGDRQTATDTLDQRYPFVPQKPLRRAYIGRARAMALFRRDGFIDRYSGDRLVFPGTLLLVSRILGDKFPTHPNWKMSQTHMAYWELYRIIDHIVPVARGGPDDESNMVTTSSIRNSAKSNWTLEELGWTLRPPGDLRDWDGLVRQFVRIIDGDQSHLRDRPIRAWYRLSKDSWAG